MASIFFRFPLLRKVARPLGDGCFGDAHLVVARSGGRIDEDHGKGHFAARKHVHIAGNHVQRTVQRLIQLLLVQRFQLEGADAAAGKLLLGNKHGSRSVIEFRFEADEFPRRGEIVHHLAFNDDKIAELFILHLILADIPKFQLAHQGKRV